MLKIDVQGGEPNVLMGAKRLMNEQRISYIYLEYTMMNGPWSGNYPIQQNNSPHVILKMMDAAGYMCFDHAGLFPFDKDEFFPRCEQDWCESHGVDKEIAAVNGDRLRLSTGDYAREYFVKTRPSDRGWHGKNSSL